jgi:hypothetical protein
MNITTSCYFLHGQRDDPEKQNRNKKGQEKIEKEEA